MARWGSVWLFGCGAAVLILRLATPWPARHLALVAAGVLPLLAAAAWYEHRRRPSLTALRAELDRLHGGGGLLMAAETESLAGWEPRLAALAAPRVVWRGGRQAAALATASLFVAATFCVPARWTARAATAPLDIQALVETLKADIAVLEQEQLLPDRAATDWPAALDQLAQDAAGTDPATAWETLDHLRDATREAAAQAAERALADTARAAEARTLAGALAELGGDALTPAALSEAMRELTEQLSAAAHADADLLATLPTGLRAALNAGTLTPEQLAQLAEHLGRYNADLANALARLEARRLIDAAALGECRLAGQCDAEGLAALLREGGTNGAAIVSLIQQYGRGGVNRGRGDAPMTWTEGSDEADAGYQEHVLPAADVAALRDSLRVGLSAAAPEVSADAGPAASGALAQAPADGGTAQTMATLPRHRGAVARYFARDPERPTP